MTATLISPPDGVLDALTGMDVLKVEANKVVFHEKFEETVSLLLKKPPRRLKQMALAHRAGQLTDVIIAYKIRRRKDIKSLIAAHTILTLHLQRLGLKKPKKPPFDELAYGVYYVDKRSK